MRRSIRSRRPRVKVKRKSKAAKKGGATARAYASSASRAADDFEDRLLAADARRALADPERVPYEQVRRDLGLDD